MVVLRRLDIRWMLVGSVLFFFGNVQDIPGQTYKYSRKEQSTIPLVEQAPEIDGKLTDPVWNQAPIFDLFMTADGRIIEDNLRSQVKLMFDKSYLYFSFLNRDPNPEKLKREMNVMNIHDRIEII